MDEENLEQAEWTRFYQRSQAGEIINNLANAMTALRNAPELVKCFAFDEMQQASVLTASLPDRPHDTQGRTVSDADVSVVQEWMQRNELRRISADTVRQAIDHRAAEKPFHPIRDYLRGLRWDGTERVKTWLRDYLHAEGSPEYLSEIGTMFLVSMIARVMQPGCKYDYMLVLEGDQGARKSSASSILAGPWFSDGLPPIGGHDHVRLSMHLRGKWLVEVAELSAMGRSETEELKAFVTRQVEQYTPKYAHKEVVEPRQCVLIGTTNKAVYLRDETGGRRFWPVKIGRVEVDALTRDRDQLFAEAAVLYRSGAQWWPGELFEAEFIKPQQEARYEVDAWEQAIATWMGNQFDKRTTTVLEIARDALQFQVARIGRADMNRITAVLNRLGWKRGARTNRSQTWERGA